MEEVSERAAHTATSLSDGRVFVAGGCVTDGCAIASAETFLIEADGKTAHRSEALSGPRSSHTATLLPDGRVVVVGGFPGEGAGVSDAVEVFDPRTGTLTQLDPLEQARGGHAAALLSDERVLVVGGWVGSGQYTADVELVDPATGRVTPGPPLPWAADALEATTLLGGRVLVTGGQVRSAQATANAAVYDPGTNTWREVGTMSTPRLKHFAVALRDGRVLVGGGTTDDRDLLASTEIFDPASDTFSPGPQLTEGRYKLPGGVAVLPDGKVLIAGGGRTVEVLDVAQGIATLVIDFAKRSSFATVNLLPNGRALVLGGYDERIQLTGIDEVLQIHAAA